MTVIGVLATNGASASGSNDNQILIPYTLAQRLSNSTGHFQLLRLRRLFRAGNGGAGGGGSLSGKGL